MALKGFCSFGYHGSTQEHNELKNKFHTRETVRNHSLTMDSLSKVRMRSPLLGDRSTSQGIWARIVVFCMKATRNRSVRSKLQCTVPSRPRANYA